MHVDFDPLKVEWEAFTNSQTPFLVQTGGYNVFRGLPYQRGNGLGSVFRRLIRFLAPIGKEVGSAIGRQGLETGNRVLSSVLEGKPLKESLVEEGKAGLKNLLEKAASNIDRQQQQQKGEGGRFDFKRYRIETKKSNRIGKCINKLGSTVGPPDFIPSSTHQNLLSKKKLKRKLTTHRSSKRFRVDTLGTY